MGTMKTFFWNIFGGFVAGLLVLVLQWLYYRFLIARRFRKIFGKHANGEFYVAYGVYSEPLPPPGSPDWKAIFPKQTRKNGRNIPGAKNLSQITSGASVRAVGYLVNAFGKNIKTSPILLSDIDIDSKLDISFISIGGTPNYKTDDLLRDPMNEFLDLIRENDRLCIKEKSSGEIIVDETQMQKTGCDYGIIMKIHPQSNLERTWICCAGFGLWGTSGAAYYLANKWKSILKWAGKEPFACVIKTTFGSDDSTEVIEGFIKKTNWFSRAIRKLRCRKNRFKITEIKEDVGA